MITILDTFKFVSQRKITLSLKGGGGGGFLHHSTICLLKRIFYVVSLSYILKNESYPSVAKCLNGD